MFIDAGSLDARSTYRLLSGALVPRPIAWVTSSASDGSTGVNLAPFSSFTWVSTFPAMLGFNITPRVDRRKDTASNIRELGEYVVNIANIDLLEHVHASSEAFDPDVSEVAVLDLETTPSAKVGVPRLADAPVSMECVLKEILQFGSTGSEFFVGEVVAFHVQDHLYSDGKVSADLLQPLARLGGTRYATLGSIHTMSAIPSE